MQPLTHSTLKFPSDVQCDIVSGSVAEGKGSQYRLLQVNEEVMASLKAGDTIYIKGDEDEEAVLCTHDKTFNMYRAETSNTLLLVDLTIQEVVGGDGGDDTSDRNQLYVRAMLGSQIELTPTAPRYAKLRRLLQETILTEAEDLLTGAGAGGYADDVEYDDDDVITGLDDDDDVIVLPSYPTPSQANAIIAKAGSGNGKRPKYHKGFTFQELLSTVQCSREELYHGLADARAVLIGGRFRSLHPTYYNHIVSFLTSLLIEQDWDGSCVPVEECVEMLPMFPRALVVSCLYSLTPHAIAIAELKRQMEYLDGIASVDDDAEVDAVKLALDTEKVSKLCGLQCLSSHRNVAVPLSTLLETWKSKLPDTIPVNAALLQGNMLCETIGEEKFVKYFPERELSVVPAERFGQLFKVREGWQLDDIKPFITPLVGPGTSLDDLMLTHTRSTLCPDGSRLYSKR